MRQRESRVYNNNNKIFLINAHGGEARQRARRPGQRGRLHQFARVFKRVLQGMPVHPVRTGQRFAYSEVVLVAAVAFISLFFFFS